MVSWTGHIVPFIVTIAIWFFATGLIAWADNRDRATFSNSIMVAGAGGLLGLIIILASAFSTSITAVYLAFIGALMVWAWHEVGFLTGAVTGPRKQPCPEGAQGLERFKHAAAAVLNHEIALALTALMLISLTWNAPNQIGAIVFTLLLGLRLASKLNMFVGVPNSTVEILPPQLDYLRSYFGENRLTFMLPITIIIIGLLATWFATLAAAAPSGSAEMVGATLLFALTLLGAIEHVFLALPFRDGMLWGWALPAKRRAATAAQSHSTIKK